MQDSVQIINPNGASRVVLVCEHAANHIPAVYTCLGLSDEVRRSHVAWDPGALDVAREISVMLDAVLVAGTVSRLVYDCNRPPEAPDAMPVRSEIHDIAGNVGLSSEQRSARIAAVYTPFRTALSRVMADRGAPVLVTVHSFTPVYNGVARPVEIGVLHDSDARLADAMLDTGSSRIEADMRRNAPYGPQDGVTHTLREHALPFGHPNVMLEIRSDLIASPEDQQHMGRAIAAWIRDALERLDAQGGLQCAG